MDDDPRNRAFESGRVRADLSTKALWLRYVSLGGNADVGDVEAYLSGLLPLPGHERDILAHALNERLADLGVDHRIPYTFDEPGGPDH
ncbi:MAG TPA: hypothetical protein VGD72_07400 [Mycobacteriales bacterium]|jgi:hypothetical protein